MKLAGKIVMGLAGTNLIYVVLSAFILFSAQPVRNDSALLSRDLLPMLDQAKVQYSMAMEGFMIQEYSHTTNVDALVGALIHNADLVKYLGLLEENVKGSPALRTPEITSGLANALSNYQEFRDLSDTLPSRLAAMNAALEDVTYGHEKLNDAILGCLRREEGAAERDEERIGGLRSLENLGYALFVSGLRGRYADADAFSQGLELTGQAERLAGELSAGAAGGGDGTADLTGLVREMGKSIASAKAHGKASGIHITSAPGDLRKWMNKGMTLNLWSNELTMIMNNAKQGLKELRG